MQERKRERKDVELDKGDDFKLLHKNELIIMYFYF